MKHLMLLFMPYMISAMDDIDAVIANSYQNRPLIEEGRVAKEKEKAVVVSHPHDESDAEEIGKKLLDLYFKDQESDMCSELLPCLIKKIEEKKNQRLSQYRRIRACIVTNIKDHENGVVPSSSPRIDETMKELILEAMQDAYKVKELENTQKIEKLKTSRIMFAAGISALTAIVGAALSATVTILLAERGMTTH